MMTFFVTKALWFVLAPSHVLVWMTCATLISVIMRWQRPAVVSAMCSVLLLIFAGIIPPVWLVDYVERQCPPATLPPHIDGILTLGGGASDRIRLLGVYELARRFPEAEVVYSGGPADVFHPLPGHDAREAEQTLLALGLDRSRLTLEGRSRNTWENLVFTKRLIKPKPGSIWVLATSASQMPRAMAVASRVNWPLIPWSTDHEPQIGRLFDVTNNLMAFDEATRELVGGIGYSSLGRASSGSRCRAPAAKPLKP